MALKSVVNAPATPQPTVSPKPDAYKGIMTLSLSSTVGNKVRLQGGALRPHQTLRLVLLWSVPVCAPLRICEVLAKLHAHTLSSARLAK